MSKISDFYPGESKNFTVNISLNGAVADLRADSVTLTLKTSYDAQQASLTASADVISAGQNGTAVFSIAPAQTQSLEPGRYVYDILWTRPNGYKRIVLAGSVNVLRRASAL